VGEGEEGRGNRSKRGAGKRDGGIKGGAWEVEVKGKSG